MRKKGLADLIALAATIIDPWYRGGIGEQLVKDYKGRWIRPTTLSCHKHNVMSQTRCIFPRCCSTLKYEFSCHCYMWPVKRQVWLLCADVSVTTLWMVQWSLARVASSIKSDDEDTGSRRETHLED
jgi:hypothetical protein